MPRKVLPQPARLVSDRESPHGLRPLRAERFGASRRGHFTLGTASDKPDTALLDRRIHSIESLCPVGIDEIEEIVTKVHRASGGGSGFDFAGTASHVRGGEASASPN